MIQMIETIQNKFWRVMYITSPGKFPARALYTPPFRTRGMSGNRPFNRRCLYLLRQRVSTLSLYTPFFPLSNSVDIIFTEILFSKSPLSQYKVFKVQTGELSEFLLGRSSPISEEKLCFQTLVFNLLTWFQLCLFFSSHWIRLCSIGNRLRALLCKSMENWSYITEGFINVHSHHVGRRICPSPIKLICLTESLYHPYIAIPILFPSHADGQIVGALRFK